TGANSSIAAAQTVSIPVTVNGRIGAPAKDGTPTANYYRFHATKGQKLVLDVNARRLGSDLDSVLDVLNVKGEPVERATVRAVLETATTLSERDSVTRGVRLLSPAGINVGDYLMIGGEIIRVEELPRGPDSDTFFDAFGAQRIAYFDTTTEAHAVDKPVYKVRIYPPGKKFAPNGLPLEHLYYRNDDGGPGYSKDSRVHFTAPADGDYVVRIRDVRGLGGDTYSYRLTLRPPLPDFRLAVDPKNPNVPAGGCIPVTVTASRMDDFEGPIQVSLQDLPAGIHATAGAIGADQVSATLLLSADANAKLERSVPLKAVGQAKDGSRLLAHTADPDDSLKLISVMPKADIVVTAETKEVDLEPGGKAQITVSIARQNGFAGRVPIEVLNLPPRVKVANVGLNGVLVTEDQTRRSFTVEALPQAEPIEQRIYVGGRVETRSTEANSYTAPQAIILRVKPKQDVAKVTHP
ncbi:MAG: c-type cytochrome domain-containing protein, partial [Bryobacteraceae bacterium]